MKRWSRKLLIGLASALVLGSSAAALPEPVTQQTPDWALQGKGEMRWFGFQLYEAMGISRLSCSMRGTLLRSVWSKRALTR